MAGVHFVPAFTGLLAPHWRTDARGAILGLGNTKTKAHITHALLDAIAWQVPILYQALTVIRGWSLLTIFR